ncbi:B84 [miniopterid betaherpesvirus 1]|uniref:B84 n=1 Tax=miniopterid betaherpesvirus 1 TaxID=3070189 RepID=I3VQ77_9BETA|nr:B84 [miniopterid betaherpesvirus 1]AFK83921.1 B84 [miniopterid betaherpesvirus 1]
MQRLGDAQPFDQRHSTHLHQPTIVNLHTVSDSGQPVAEPVVSTTTGDGDDTEETAGSDPTTLVPFRLSSGGARIIQPHASMHTEFLTVDDNNPTWPPYVDRRTCNLLRINMHTQPDDLSDTLEVMFFDEATPLEARTAICISSDRNSEVQTAFTIASTYRGEKSVRIVDKDDMDNCLLRLCINVFAIRLVVPTTDLLPLRRRIASENRRPTHSCDPDTMISVAVEDDRGTELIVRVDATNVLWKPIPPALSGSPGVILRLLSRLPQLLKSGGRPRFRFAKPLWISDPGAAILKVSMWNDNLGICVVRRESTHDSRQRHFPGMGDISMRLRLCNTNPHGPYLSATPEPCMRYLETEYCFQVLAPHDFTVSKRFPYRLRVYRKHYGGFLAIFAPTFRRDVRITCSLWLPRTWLTIWFVSENPTVIYRGEPIGKMYFVRPDDYRIGQHQDPLPRFADRVVSTIAQGQHSMVASVLGATINLADLPRLSLKRHVIGNTHATTVSIAHS